MPKARLTLSVDEDVLGQAKRFSARHGTTVSKLVTTFLTSLDDGEDRDTPVVASLRGVLDEGAVRGGFREHLTRKHGG